MVDFSKIVLVELIAKMSINDKSVHEGKAGSHV